MKITALVHMYPPRHNAGAEWMLHSLLRAMVKRGHEALVLVPRIDESWELDGVRVRGGPLDSQAAALFAASSVAVTHLDYTRDAMRWAAAYRVPLAHLVHNEYQLSHNGVTSADLIVYNSRWLAGAVGRKGIVCRPPVDCSDVRTDRVESRVTLINLSASKGVHVLEQLARRFPERRFLGVVGAYDLQEPPQLENVEVLPQTGTIRDVYARTRVLLVPSSYESYGRVAVEACCNGIPVIAHPTAGLLEALDYAGIWADRQDIATWEFHVRALDDEAHYEAAARRSLARARELDPAPVYERFERALERIAR